MRSLTQTLVIAGLSSLIATIAQADSEIVNAIRNLQAEGASHSHLYLYREDEKLLRQLTNDNSGQDSGPIFAPDGSVIVFTREKPKDVREFWSIEPHGTHLKKLEVAPDWYAGAKSSPYFTNVEPEEGASAAATTSRRNLPHRGQRQRPPTNRPMVLSNWSYAKIPMTKMIRSTGRVMRSIICSAI